MLNTTFAPFIHLFHRCLWSIHHESITILESKGTAVTKTAKFLPLYYITLDIGDPRDTQMAVFKKTR